MNRRYRFGALPQDAHESIAKLYNETVARQQSLPGAAKGTLVPVVEESILFTHTIAATQALYHELMSTEVAARPKPSLTLSVFPFLSPSPPNRSRSLSSPGHCRPGSNPMGGVSAPSSSVWQPSWMSQARMRVGAQRNRGRATDRWSSCKPRCCAHALPRSGVRVETIELPWSTVPAASTTCRVTATSVSWCGARIDRTCYSQWTSIEWRRF